MAKGLNEGQKELIRRYAIPYSQNFFSRSKTGLDDNKYFKGFYAQHEAMESALDGYVEIVYGGMLVVYAASVIAATEVESRFAMEEIVMAEMEMQSESFAGYVDWGDVNNITAAKPAMWDGFEFTMRQFIGADERPHWHSELLNFTHGMWDGRFGETGYPPYLMDSLKNLVGSYRDTGYDPMAPGVPPGYVTMNPYTKDYIRENTVYW